MSKFIRPDARQRIHRMLEKHLRKTLHLDLTQAIHTDFRIACLQKGLSMQCVVEELAARVARGDPYMMDVLDMLVKSKLDKTIRELSELDVETVYNAIELENPLVSED